MPLGSRLPIAWTAIACAATLTAGSACAAPASSAAGDPARASAASPACATSGLVIWLDTQGDNAAGSSYYQLKFTNLSGRRCTLHGYPGISAVGLGGAQLGSAGGRDTSSTPVVQVASGATVDAVLRITVAGNFPSARCHSVTAAGLRVYPPNQTAAKVIPFPFSACSKAGPVYLNVKAVA
jgi:Domain of unknown function (DUF4232)